MALMVRDLPHGSNGVYPIPDQCVVPVGAALPAGAGLAGRGSIVCDGGSRARAMATRQASCEVEMVPSLHSNLAGPVSATGGGLSGAAACGGAGAWAAGFDSAQAAHDRAISKTTPNRICVASSNDDCGR
jgi:hypothetical protein